MSLRRVTGMDESGIPTSKAGRNIAIKLPAAEYDATIQFYKDILGLPILARIFHQGGEMIR